MLLYILRKIAAVLPFLRFFHLQTKQWFKITEIILPVTQCFRIKYELKMKFMLTKVGL